MHPHDDEPFVPRNRHERRLAAVLARKGLTPTRGADGRVNGTMRRA